MAHRSDQRPVYLNIIWHQHQPLYVDTQRDCLIAPWVRIHATKDYYDMAAIVEQYPNIHYTVNLTTPLLYQLQEYYIRRLARCVDLTNGTIDLNRFHREVEGTTDPWVDLLLKPAEQLDDSDRDDLYRNAWCALAINEVMLERFPEYENLALRFRDNGDDATVDELRQLKFWFFLAYFDPDFLNGPVRLPTGNVCDLSMFVVRRNGKYFLRRSITEDDCKIILIEAFKVFMNIIPIHKQLRYDPGTRSGQIELTTTPYMHPILPLIYDSNIARICQPYDPLPLRFSFPQDAEMHIKKAIAYYKRLFDDAPVGMWPAEGSVSQETIPLFARNGIRWIATDRQILERSSPAGSHVFPHRITTEWSDVVLFFRDTRLSDNIGFDYQTMSPEHAVSDFIHGVMSVGVQDSEQDKLVTVILDGENAWEWYRFDHDGKRFLHLLYQRLEELFAKREVVTVTPTEFLLGNPDRRIPSHPPSTLNRIDRLWPGSWIHANFDTWIGEEEENKAWSYLLQARTDLEKAAVPPLSSDSAVPNKGTREWYAYQAWEALYAAEGSDWFWWYGEDQNAAGGDRPFDELFLAHLRDVYHYAKKYGAKIEEPSLEGIVRERVKSHRHRKAMVRGMTATVPVLFCCKIPDGMHVDALYIVGNREELGEWVPNTVAMYNDGTHGDEIAGDCVWSLMVDLPRNAEIHYKYTLGGRKGMWDGDECPGKHRTLVVNDGDRIVIRDEFGKL